MQITTSNPYAQGAFRRPSANLASLSEQPSDSVTFSYSNNSYGGAAFFGGAGLVPVVGFMSNFGIGAQAGFNDHSTASKAAGFGALANLGGTAALAGGLIFGSNTVTNVGLGLLGVSGLAGAYAGFVAS